MCYIVFIIHSLHWRYIKIALQEYVTTVFITTTGGDCIFKTCEIPVESIKQVKWHFFHR